MRKNKFIFNLMLLLAIVGLLAACQGEQAEQAGSEGDENVEWPSDDVTIIVPYAPGGVSDINARAFASVASNHTDHRFTVKNVSGAGGTIGNYELVKADPDGNTILWGASSHLASSLHILDTQYTMDDYTIVNKVGHLTAVLMAPEDSPFDDLTDLVDYAHENPGKLDIGNSGEGTVITLLSALLQKNTEIDAQDIPFNGGGPELAAVMGGHVDAAMLNISEVKAAMESGKLKALAVLSENRIDAAPDVPTVGELGYPETSGGASHFVVIPKDVPEAVKEAIDEFSQKVYEDDEFKEILMKSGFQLEYKNQEDARAELDEWYETAGELYKIVGELD